MLISLRKLAYIFAVTIVALLPLVSQMASALSPEQQKLFRENINYFDINTCDPTNAATPTTTSNSNMYVIGDSLTVGMRDEGNLKAKLSNGGWSVTDVEATSGISIDDSIPKIEADKNSAVSKAGTIVVGLGTNPAGGGSKSAIDKMLTAIKNTSPNAKIYWINAYSTKDDYSSFNSALKADESPDKITKVLDWSQEAKSNAGDYDLSSGGGIHPSAKGYIKRSEWLVNNLGNNPSAQAAGANISNLSEEDKISSTFNVGFDASSTSKDEIERVVKKYKIGGIFILGTKDAAGAGFTKEFFSKLNSDAGHTLVTASDEEGIFKRYSYSFNFPNAKEMGAKSTSEVKAIGSKVGEALAGNGINTDLAPVLDVAINSSNTVAGTASRAFSDNDATVTSKAGAFAEGLREAGVNPVYKHFPGLGSSTGNTDTTTVTSPSIDELKKQDLKPYEALANKNGAAVMLDNARIPGLTKSGDVASISPETVKLLRDDYKFNGLITTDDLAADGVKVPVSSAIVRALKA